MVSIKCYIIRFREDICLTIDSSKLKYIVKIMNPVEIKEFSERSGKPFEEISDKWILITPKSPHIIECYEVYRDIAAHY